LTSSATNQQLGQNTMQTASQHWTERCTNDACALRPLIIYLTGTPKPEHL